MTEHLGPPESGHTPSSPLMAIYLRLRKRFSFGKLAENTFFGTFWQFVRVALHTLSIITLARAFGPAGYGTLAGLTGLATSLGTLVGLGTGFLLLRAVSHDQDAFAIYWRKSLSAIGASGLALALLFCLIASAFVGTHASWTVLAIISLSELLFYPYVQLANWAFQAHERMGWANALPAAMSANRFLVALLFIIFMPGRGLVAFLWLYLGVSALTAIASLLLVRAILKPRAVTAKLSLAEVREGLGFTAQWFTSSAMTEVDKTLVLRLAGSEVTGLYAVAYRMATALSLPIGALTQAALPRLFRYYRDPSAGDPKLVGRLLLVALAYAVAGMLVLQAIAGILPMILGSGFTASVDAVRWLALWLPCYGMRVIGSTMMMASGHHLLRAWTELIAVFALFCLAVALVPRYQLLGAVASAVLAEALLALLTWTVIWKSRLLTRVST